MCLDEGLSSYSTSCESTAYERSLSITIPWGQHKWWK
jgi:hypothetical protein